MMIATCTIGKCRRPPGLTLTLGCCSLGFVVNAALYEGPVNEERIAANPCDPAFKFLGAVRTSWSGTFASAFYGVNVTANATYTIIVSGGQRDQTGMFGVVARPTVLRQLTVSPTFNQPARGQAAGPCQPRRTSSSWFAYAFQARTSQPGDTFRQARGVFRCFRKEGNGL
eukprot:TRINITY_DN2868_c1_g1_i3.p2 TRINITY_DN2868_c1_g1~~TRINITY_DN2868_c1_g1_i3.p2  ORF type:complete len:170 (+),score=6.04 TRINITY_DN2868_c1_g1_i3:376-885(+)